MSAPGHLTDTELETIDGVPRIGGGSPRALAVCARRVEACNQELINAFGFGLTISNGGDYRTAAEQDALYASGGTDTTTANSMHCRGQAIDIFNQRSFRDADEALFITICGRHGINFTVAGEPWHGVISTLAFSGGIPDSTTTTTGSESTPVYALMLNNDDNAYYLIRENGDWVHVKNPEHLDVLRRMKAAFCTPGLSGDKWAGWAQKLVKQYLQNPIDAHNEIQLTS